MKILKLLVFLGLLLNQSYFCLAQGEETVRYFNNGFIEYAKRKTIFQRYYSKKGSVFFTEDYQKDNLISEGIFDGFNSAEEVDDFILKNQLNQEAGEKDASLDKRIGLVTTYKRGYKSSEIMLGKGASYFLKVWDTNGNNILRNGNGELISENDTEKRITVYRDSLLAEDFGIRKEIGDTLYYFVNQPAEPVGGYSKFKKQLNQYLAREKFGKAFQYYGSIHIQTIIDENGNLTEMKSVTSIHNENDELELLETLKGLPRWNPAYFSGRSVKTKVVFSVIF